jgi:hypothetical protein
MIRSEEKGQSAKMEENNGRFLHLFYYTEVPVDQPGDRLTGTKNCSSVEVWRTD